VCNLAPARPSFFSGPQSRPDSRTVGLPLERMITSALLPFFLEWLFLPSLVPRRSDSSIFALPSFFCFYTLLPSLQAERINSIYQILSLMRETPEIMPGWSCSYWKSYPSIPPFPHCSPSGWGLWSLPHGSEPRRDFTSSMPNVVFSRITSPPSSPIVGWPSAPPAKSRSNFPLAPTPHWPITFP